MNRYGEAIRTQRLALGWSEKELARKAGITEKVLREAESGKRILAEALAERLIGCMCGPSDTPVLNPYADEPEAAASKTEQAVKAQGKAPQTTYSLGDGVAIGQVAQLPIIDIKGGKLGTRAVALDSERAKWMNGAFYLPCPDDALRGFRVHRGDMLLMTPDKRAEEGALVLLQQGDERMLAKLVRTGEQVRPARMDKKLEILDTMPKIVARAVLAEFTP